MSQIFLAPFLLACEGRTIFSQQGQILLGPPPSSVSRNIPLEWAKRLSRSMASHSVGGGLTHQPFGNHRSFFFPCRISSNSKPLFFVPFLLQKIKFLTILPLFSFVFCPRFLPRATQNFDFSKVSIFEFHLIFFLLMPSINCFFKIPFAPNPVWIPPNYPQRTWLGKVS